MIRRSPVAAAGIAFLALAACNDRDEQRALASLVAVHDGSVDKSIAGKDWTGAAAGDDFSRGDKLRTSADGSARLRIVDSQLDIGPSTLLSFGERLEVTGELRPVGGDVELELALGDVTIRSGSAVRVGAERFEILIGAATLERGDESFELGAGDSLVLEVGRATVERDRPPDAGPPDAGPAPSAEIRVSVSGRAATIQAPGERRERLRGDAVLEPGTTLRLPRRSRADIVRGDEALRLQGPAVVVTGSDGGALVSMRSGSGTATATRADVILALPGGRLVVEAAPGEGSAAELSVSRRGARIQVRRGRARLEGEGGEPEALGHGEAASLDRRGGVTITERAPAIADAVVRGDARVHARTRTVDLRVDFSGACPGDGVVEVAGRKGYAPPARAGRGTGGVNLRVSRGTSRYRVRCVRDGVIDDEVALEGTLRVDGDLGTRKIATVPPTSTVEADGRRYTVLYQNKLPAIVFAWRDAPKAASYELVIERGRGRPRRFDSDEARVSVRSGALREGRYDFYFESPRGSSRRSELRIAFDNAASSAYISSPGLGESWRGETLLVAGATLPGWSVRANGIELPIDGQQRFRRRIPRPDSGRLGIEFVHPSRGRHIYIRRAGGDR